MNSIALACGHLFHYNVGIPDDLTFCFRCDDYQLPVNYVPRVRRSRDSSGTLVVPEIKTLDPLPYTPVREPGGRIPTAERPEVVKKAQALAQEGYSAAQIGKAFGVAHATAAHWLTET